jgi:8-oxo-dGTP diphosphatase
MEKNPTLFHVVAAALTNESGRILLQRRPDGKPMAGLWEFPGGKVEAGEDYKSALKRELEEELGINCELQDMIPVTFAYEPAGDRQMLLLLFQSSNWQNEPAPLHASELGWFFPSEMRDLPMPPADLPFIEILEWRRTTR